MGSEKRAVGPPAVVATQAFGGGWGRWDRQPTQAKNSASSGPAVDLAGLACRVKLPAPRSLLPLLFAASIAVSISASFATSIAVCQSPTKSRIKLMRVQFINGWKGKPVSGQRGRDGTRIEIPAPYACCVCG